MRYLLVQTQDGYWEKPVAEGSRHCRENLWRTQNGKNIFYLDEETHVFDREEDVAISSGIEADIIIPALKSRIYIRGMKAFFEKADEEHMYINQEKILPGNFMLYSGDVLFLKCIKLLVREKEICIQGSSDIYATTLFEKAQLSRPFEGFPVYKRSPRLMKYPSKDKMIMELPGERKKQKKKGLLMTVLPPLGMTAVTTVVGFLIGRGIYMLMSVSATGMTVLFSAAKYFHDKKELTEKGKNREKRYIAYMRQKQKEFAAAYENEREIYHYRYPDIAGICRMVKEYDSRIYERIPSDDDFLTVAVGHGRGDTSFKIELKEPGWDEDEDELSEMGRELCRKFSVIDKPEIIDLKKAHLGVAGDKVILHRQLKVMIAQLAFFQSYHDLQMIVVCEERYKKEFEWMRWLPHMRIEAVNVLGMVYSERTRDIVLGSMSQILKERACRRGNGENNVKSTKRVLPHYLFIIDEPSLIMDHAIMEYLCMDGREMGFSLICTSSHYIELPEYTETVLFLKNSNEGILLLEEKVYRKQKIELYQIQGEELEWMARNLSALKHEKGMTCCIPESVTFFEMYGVRRPEELEIRKRWEENRSYRSLAVPLGMRSKNELLYLNLHEKAHGPHGLLAGMTGSGKSELIQTLILSLAVNFHPYEVGFLLIDYKGGGMANLFKNLPHHLGTITNLDAAGSMRALVSVKAELLKRQRLFERCGVNHINGYMELFRKGTEKEPVPHLFVISDEFAELKREQPDFMKELVSAARIGRSLGVHLILATQKPAGVVDEQIWSNSRFKVCLKVQDEGDSREVLRTPDAAGLNLPGRAWLQVGNNEIYELFQSAMSGASYYREQEEETADGSRIYVMNELGQGELLNHDPGRKEKSYFTGKTQLEVLVEHISELYEQEDTVEVKRPWLPPLGEMLLSPYVTENGRALWLPGKEEASLFPVCLGKMDLPGEQRQEEYEHRFVKDGNLLFTSSAGFGKTVFLTTVLVSLALLYDVDVLNFYILDFGNSGMMPLKELPHTADYISIDDSERYWKFKKLMTEEIAARKKMFARYAAPSPEAYMELSGKALKIIIIAVDQLDVVKESGIEEEEFFTKLTRDGAGLGIYMAASAARINGIRQATLHNFKYKLTGFHYDENETFLTVGKAADRQTEIKGRALSGSDDVYAVQIYTVAPCGHGAVYSRTVKRLVQDIKCLYPGKGAPHIPVLPEELRGEMLEEYADDGSDYIIGLDVEDVTGRGFGKTAGIFVIIGNAGTGKTNMMCVLAGQASQKGRTYIFDAKGMELYHYRLFRDVLYVENKKQADMFMEEVTEEIRLRRAFLKEQMEKYPEKSPKKLISEMDFFTVLIDDVDDFTEFMKADLARAVRLLKEACALGIACIITVHAGKSRGMDEMSRLVKQASDGLVLSAQGVVPVFPVTSMRELPGFGEGLLFKNGAYRRVRLPEGRREGRCVCREISM